MKKYIFLGVLAVLGLVIGCTWYVKQQKELPVNEVSYAEEAENMVYVMDKLFYSAGIDVSKEVIECIEQISIDSPYIGTIQSVVDNTFRPTEELQANFGTAGAEVVFYDSSIAVEIDGKWIWFINEAEYKKIKKDTFVNLCLSSFYGSPKDVDLEGLFYNGLGLEVNESDQKFLEQQGAELDYDIIKLPASEMNKILMKYFGISLSESNMIGIEKFYAIINTVDDNYTFLSNQLYD